MIPKSVETAMNKQINMELYSSYVYLAMSAYFNSLNLDGFSLWMRLQAQEELMHSMKLFDFVIERDGTVELTSVKAPPHTWKSPLDACQNALKHERLNTKQINDLVELAYKQKDHASRIFLQWFVEEQVEEESSALKLVEKVKLVGKDSGALYILDQDVGKRTLPSEA